MLLTQPSPRALIIEAGSLKLDMQLGKPSKVAMKFDSRIYNPARAGLIRIFQGSADRAIADAPPGFRILTADGRIIPSR